MKEIERFLKKILKKKQKYTKALLITFLMTGGLSVATPIAPNANGEYIVNSSTGDGEVNISGGTRNIFKVDDGKKLTFTGAGDVFSTTATTPPTPRPLLTISGSNTEFFGTGITNKAEFSSEDNIVLYSVKDIGGNYINGSNQKVTFKNMKAGDASISSGEPAIKVEAKNGNNIKGAEFNLIGTTNNDDDEFGIAQNSNWVVEVEGDATNNKYSELTVNVKGNTSITGLMHKEAKSVINVNLEDGGKWSFSKNYKNGSTTTTINSLNIGNDGILDVTFYPSESDGETGIYTMKLTSDGINNDGTLTNAGEINLYNGSYKDVFTIEGNYHGNNGNIIMNTLWNAPGGENGENSESDLVYITGNASGSTRVSPSSFEDEADYNVIDGTIQQLSTRLNSVPVVKVAGNSTPTTFTGTAKTAGAAEAQLTSRQVNGIWEYYWTISPLESSGATAGIIGGTTGGSSGSSRPIYIMAQPVSAYVLMPKVNMEMGYSTVGTLHERRGENRILDLENMSADKGQIWTRIYGSGLNENGTDRFQYEGNLYGVQIGHDFKINKDKNGNDHLLGGYISYNRANTDFFDEYRAENGKISDSKYTGKGKSESISLGITKTKYTPKDSYYDLVGQVSYLQNKYNSRDDYSAKQNGFGLLLSGEAGKSFNISKNGNWSVEPQAQLIYQYLNTKSFNDGLRNVNQDNRNGLRGRAGVRLAYNGDNGNSRTNSYYAVANVWHDFTKYDSKYTNIGSDKITEKLGTTWGEIGLGAQAPLGQKSNLYVDTRYEHSFNNSNRSGYKGTIGFKHTF
ncbi:autotransporter outer membrane beta-barrel domain-containing protein [Leptotrichia wadei]|uniref:Outer membrane autotransporter barrel domain protein n=1 Tax=Leptotrichia wadei TaxID=157687 RepID=A0A510KIN7_9FUSO|nr:autotransporter outer membrane beta-barrel domain-containing protein [Leptotrichia wadei]BBM50521.1 outer membrane autotransporter barrel domain protein [Leptotrichia wadei]